MTLKPTEARPLFGGLAAILAILGLLMAIVIGWVKLDDSLLASIGAFIGGGVFALAMFFVAAAGKVPLFLAYFLAPPSAGESPSSEKDRTSEGGRNRDWPRC